MMLGFLDSDMANCKRMCLKGEHFDVCLVTFSNIRQETKRADAFSAHPALADEFAKAFMEIECGKLKTC